VRAAERGEDAREAVPVGPRHAGPEDRNVRQLARCLVEHPALAADLERTELSELLPRGPHTELALALADAARNGRAARITEIAESLSDEARQLLHALSVDGDPVPEANAARTVRDTVIWLREQRRKRDANEIKRRMNATQDPQEKSRLFDEMQRILERRRDDSPPADHTTVGPPA